MKAQALKWIKLFLKFGLAFVIIGYMVYTGRLDLAVVRQGLSRGNVVAACMGLVILASVIALYRWRILLRGQGIDFQLGHVFRYGLIGCFFNTTMPGAVSGDIIKAWYVLSENKGQEKTPVLTSILLDRAMGVFGLVIVSFVPLAMQWKHAWSNPQLHNLALLVSAMALAVACFFIYLALSVYGPFAAIRRKMEALRKIPGGEMGLKAYDAFMSYRKHPEALLQALLMSVCTHISVVTSVIFAALALGDNHLSLYQYFLLVPVGLITTAIPIAPGGLGVGHVAFQALFQLAGSPHGAEIFTLYIMLQIMVNLTGVFFYLRAPKIAVAEAVE